MAYVLTFGKYKGLSMDEVWQRDADYVRWLADKSYVAAARRAANEVIRASAHKDEETVDQLLASLKQIAKSKPLPCLKQYKYIHTDVRRDYACIEFCTHNIYSDGGFISDIFMDEDWDIVALATYHQGLEDAEIDEEEPYVDGHEYPRYKARQVGTVPLASAAVWYAMRDNSEQHPLNAQPVTMAEAVEFLEQYLATKCEAK